MRWVLAVWVLLVARPARAESVGELLAVAHNIARDGRCEALPAVGARVRELDPGFYATVFAVDPLIVGCTHDVVVLAPPPEQPRSPHRSEAAALTLSLAGTVAGYVLAAEAHDNDHVGDAGLVLFAVGPTLGQAYAGNTFNRGLGIRAGGLALIFIGGPLTIGSSRGCCVIANGAGGAAVLTAGVLMYLGGSIYEIASAPGAARRFNAEHGIEAAIVPTGTGLAVAGRF